MDGFAVCASNLTGNRPFEIPVVGTSFAGHPYADRADPGSAVRIFTGAAMPEGFDAVAIQEDCEILDDVVRIGVNITAGDNVRQIGHDIGNGERIVSRGQVLTPFTVGWLAACGHTHVPVIAQPKVAIFSTGDELREPGSTLAPGQIYDSNRHLLAALLAGLPVEVLDLGALPDDKQATRAGLEAAAAEADVLLTSGGVSVGDADFVTAVLDEIGKLDIWRLNIKPGKPLAYGRLGHSLFFGLPGNPVSTAVTFLLIARPAILQLCGAEGWESARHSAKLSEPIRHKPGREEYQRGMVVTGNDGTRVAVTGDQSSNRLASFSNANCLIRIPKESGDLPIGTEVTVLPFFGLI